MAPSFADAKKRTCPWLSNLFNAVIEPVDFHFWIVDRQAILVSIPPHAFVIPLPKMASRRPMSSFDKKVQRTTVIGVNIEPFLIFFNSNSTCTQKIALSYRPGVKVSSFPCHSWSQLSLSHLVVPQRKDVQETGYTEFMWTKGNGSKTHPYSPHYILSP